MANKSKIDKVINNINQIIPTSSQCVLKEEQYLDILTSKQEQIIDLYNNRKYSITDISQKIFGTTSGYARALIRDFLTDKGYAIEHPAKRARSDIDDLTSTNATRAQEMLAKVTAFLSDEMDKNLKQLLCDENGDVNLSKVVYLINQLSMVTGINRDIGARNAPNGADSEVTVKVSDMSHEDGAAMRLIQNIKEGRSDSNALQDGEESKSESSN